MDQFSATDAALAGFRAASEKPRTVAIWAAIMAVLSFVVTLLVVGTFGDKLTALTEALEADPDPQTTMAAMSGLWPLFVCSIVYVLITNSVLLAAVNRLVLRPHDGAGAYLRLGADELRQALVQVVLYVVLFIAYFVGVIVVALLAAIGAGVGGQGLGLLLGLVSGMALLAGLVLVSVRLSFVSTLAFDTRRIDLKTSWDMTKGRFWPLFGAYVIATVLAVVVYLLLIVIIAAVGAIGSLALGGDLASVGDALQNEAKTMKDLLSVSGVISSLLSGLMSVLVSLIVFAPAPTIYAQLKGGEAPNPFG